MKVSGLLLLALVAAAQDDPTPYTVYANGATSERNLPLCAGPREACNVVHLRFWLPHVVYRMCKCPDRTNCPTEFTDLSDKRSIAFNARGQLKIYFGHSTTEIKNNLAQQYNCRNEAVAHTCQFHSVRYSFSDEQHEMTANFCSRVGELDHCGVGNSVAAGIGSNGTIHIHCFCGPNHFYHRLYRNATGEYFKCMEYGSCKRGEFCGHIAADSYETYHTCTCPARHICILQDRNKVYAEEFLHKGLAYRGICTPTD